MFWRVFTLTVDTMKKISLFLLVVTLMTLFGCIGGAESAAEIDQIGTQTAAWERGRRVFIHFFNASPAVVDAGQPVSLTWTAPGAVNVEIVGVAGGLPAQGQYTVYPSESKVYVLRAFGAMGAEMVRNTQVTVNPVGNLAYFYSSNASVSPGQASTLAWQANGCSRVELFSTGELPHQVLGCSGSLIVSPRTTTAYTLYAYGLNNQLIGSNAVTVQVLEDQNVVPVIDGFYASSGSVDAGSSVTLFWNVRNGTNVTISGTSGGQFGPSGSTEVRPWETTTYVLVAYGPRGQAVQGSVVVHVNKQPVIESFYASPSRLNLGQETILSWNARSCARAEITGAPVGQLGCSGTLRVQPRETTQYTLVVYGFRGEAVNMLVTVVVDQPLPRAAVEYFYASNLNLEAGQGTTLYWKTLNATRVELVGAPQTSVAATSSVDVRPTLTTTYQLNVYGASGEVVTNYVTVNVRPKPSPSIEYFYASNASLEPGQGTTLYWKVNDAARVEVVGLPTNPVAAISSMNIVPPQTTKYQLIVHGFNGEVVTGDLTIYVYHHMTDAEALEYLLSEMRRNP